MTKREETAQDAATVLFNDFVSAAGRSVNSDLDPGYVLDALARLLVFVSKLFNLTRQDVIDQMSLAWVACSTERAAPLSIVHAAKC